MVKQQSELSYVSLPKGMKQKKVNILGRAVTLVNGEAYSGIIVKTFPEYFKSSPYAVDNSSDVSVEKQSEEVKPENVTEEQILVDNSSDVSVEKQSEEVKPKVGRPKKDKE